MQAEHERDERPFDPEAPREHYARPHHFAVNSANDIIMAMARAFWVDAWASREEEEGRRPAGPGEDLMDAAPPTPAVAIHFARKYAKDFQTANDADLMALYERAAGMPGKHDEEPTEEAFGHYIAMEAMGHGVSWADDHPDHGFVVPSMTGEHHELAFDVEEDEDEDEDDEATEELRSEWKQALEEAADVMANQDAAVVHSTLGDQDQIDLEKDGYHDDAVAIATFGYETAVDGDILVPPHWVKRLDLEETKHPQTWREAKRAGGSMTAAMLIYSWFAEHGYEKCRNLGGTWPGGQETELSREHVLSLAAREIEAGPDEMEVGEEVATELFGRGTEVYWSSSNGDIEVWAVPLDAEDSDEESLSENRSR